MLLDGRLARFDDIAAAAIEAKTTDELELRWSVGDKPDLRVVGTINGRHRVDQPIVRDDLPSAASVWNELLDSKRLVRRWDRQRMALMIPFAAAETEDERLNMRTSIEFVSPTIGKFGTFRDVRVTGVRLCPDSNRAATEWARHQIAAQVSGVQTKRVYELLTQRVRTTFADWSIDLPSREELARHLASKTGVDSRPKSFWALQAALDWNL
jgi:hypothetical protein